MLQLGPSGLRWPLEHGLWEAWKIPIAHAADPESIPDKRQHTTTRLLCPEQLGYYSAAEGKPICELPDVGTASHWLSRTVMGIKLLWSENPVFQNAWGGPVGG